MHARSAALCALAVAAAGCDRVFGLDALYVCLPDDEDCDELPDGDDPCPGDPGTAVDEDGDGIGDECDPNLGLAVDKQLEFESFAALDPRWTVRDPATWQVRDGALVLEAGAVERAAPANWQPSVELFVTPTFRSEGAIVGAFVASKASTGTPLECRVEHHAGGDDLVMVIGDPAIGRPTEVARATKMRGSPEDGLRIYGGQLSAFKVRCHARYGTSDALYVEWTYFTSPADFDTIGFRVEQASAAYRALTIYTRTR